jgi:uncharacterized protein (DUF488 family)
MFDFVKNTIGRAGKRGRFQYVCAGGAAELFDATAGVAYIFGWHEVLRISGKNMVEKAITAWTIGHSTRGIEEFIDLKKGCGIDLVVDVRSVPYSRRNPHFGRVSLAARLEEARVAYAHLPGLGGFRPALPDSSNTGLANASFRGYADYIMTPEFDAHMLELIGCAGKARTAIMCDEDVPGRCHCSLIADALVARGVSVPHIMAPGVTRPYGLAPAALFREGRVIYPPA